MSSGLRPAGLRLFVSAAAFLAFAVVFDLAYPAVWAADEIKPEERIVQKEVSGQVIWVGKRAISVEYDRTASEVLEILLPFDGKTLKLERLKSLAELKRGDTIHVRYNQTLRKNEETGEESVVNTAATQVALVRQAPVDILKQSSELTSSQ